MNYSLRKAKITDQTAIENLIVESVRGLSRADYDERQIELSIKTVFGVDKDLIADETYYVAVANDGTIVGGGGWSKRRTLYGASSYAHSRDAEFLDPRTDAAKIRAFFIHPEWARRGIGRAILDKCEAEAKSLGFRTAEMMATLPGVRLYAVCGYAGDEEVKVPVGENVDIVCIRMRKNLA